MADRLRDNFGRFRNKAAVLINKELERRADKYQLVVTEIVRDKLEETYKTNLEASYRARTTENQMVNEQARAYNERNKSREAKEGYKRRLNRQKETYHHTNTLLNSVQAVVDGNTVKIELKPATYDNGRTVQEVHDFLTKGTHTQHEFYIYNYRGRAYPAINYDTPVHDFEIHTKLQMKGFLESLASDIENDPDKYDKYYK